MNDNDLVWENNPRQWHQQTARTVDHRFSTFDEFASFARNSKKAGVSVLMLVQIQKTEACPGMHRMRRKDWNHARYMAHQAPSHTLFIR